MCSTSGFITCNITTWSVQNFIEREATSPYNKKICKYQCKLYKKKSPFTSCNQEITNSKLFEWLFIIFGICHHLKSTVSTAVNVFWAVYVYKVQISLVLIFSLKQCYHCPSYFSEWKYLIHWYKYNLLFFHFYKADNLLHIFGLIFSNKRYSLESLVTVKCLSLNETRKKNIKKKT